MSTVTEEIDALFRGSTETRVGRTVRRLERIAKQFEQARQREVLARLERALRPLAASVAEQRRILKRYQRPPEAGAIAADETRALLEFTPSAPNVAGVNEEDMSALAILTTRDMDRQGDIVRPAGGDLDNYRLNPVVLAHHASDSTFPVGVFRSRSGEFSVWYDAQNDWLVGRIYFDRDPRNELSRQAWSLVRQGILAGVSIGFTPKVSRPLPSGGNDFVEWELCEVSLVCVPANPKARIVSEAILRRGMIDGKTLHPAIRKALFAGVLRDSRHAAATAGVGRGDAEKEMRV